MYVGRIVAVGMNKSGNLTGMYRVSSRSFPNRETRKIKNKIAVMPKAGFEEDLNKNPYIAYNCIRLSGTKAVISNGSHTDPIVEKIAAGYPAKDALVLSLLALDYEKDHLSTPRIAGIIDAELKTGFLGTVRKDALQVKEFSLVPGMAYYVATYEHSTPCEHYKDENFTVNSAKEAAGYIFNKGVFEKMEKPVTSAAVISTEEGFETATEI
ncbi:MAG: IMP cyclohydrolase [Victivallales bacterium]|nr:IMP cyclohydrolase [Victivallales bacterium]